MHSFSENAPASRNFPLFALIIGDLSAFLIFVIIGRLSHGFTSDWLLNIARIATPFLLGWAVAALALGVYRANLLQSPTRFLLLSAAAVVFGDLIGFGLRATLFQDNVTLPFALTTLAFTLLFVAGWRGVLAVWVNGPWGDRLNS